MGRGIKMDAQNFNDKNLLGKDLNTYLGNDKSTFDLKSEEKYRKNPLYTIIMEFHVQTLHINLSLN
jgi:hypothetical protein